MARPKSCLSPNESGLDGLGRREREDLRVVTAVGLRDKTRRARSSLTKDGEERKACELVRYMMLSDHRKHPVKRADILQSVMTKDQEAFSAVLEAAREKMRKIFGMDIIELKARSSKFYIIVNVIHSDLLEEIVDRSDSGHEMGLLSIILTLIFMNSAPLPEAQLWNVLKTLGIKKDAVHEVFGNVNKVIEEFVKQMYLDCRKVTDAEEKHLVYEWGARARKELNPEDVLMFVAKIHGMDVEVWRKQYEHQLKGKE